VSPHRGVDRDHRAWVVVGWVLIQALMWTVPDEVMFVPAQDDARVPFVVQQDPIGALCPDAANEPLRDRVRPRRPRRSLDHVDACGGEHSVEGPGELGVPVADQEPGCRSFEPLQAELAALPRAAVVVEDRYSAIFKLDHIHPAQVADGFAELQIRWPNVPIVYA
jgi:hypothetical protein